MEKSVGLFRKMLGVAFIIMLSVFMFFSKDVSLAEEITLKTILPSKFDEIRAYKGAIGDGAYWSYKTVDIPDKRNTYGNNAGGYLLIGSDVAIGKKFTEDAPVDIHGGIAISGDQWESVYTYEIPFLSFQRSEGTFDDTDPTPIAPAGLADTLGVINFIGRSGNLGFSRGAHILSVVDGVVMSSSVPGNLQFFTRDTDAANEALRMIITSSGRVGMGTAVPQAALDVVGNIHCTGKIDSDGGSDPPYVAFNMETRQEIIERVENEIPVDKLEQAVLFWNSQTARFEVYLPTKGQFVDLQGQILARAEEAD